MSTVEPTPRAVSEEDREAAIEEIGDALDLAVQGDTPDVDWIPSKWPEESAKIIDALISHGWGPKPKVTRHHLFARFFKAKDGLTREGVERTIKAIGVEVTD